MTSCSPKEDEQTEVLKVGIIASLTGPGQLWGQTSLNCARVVADHHNAKGSFIVDGKQVMIELVVYDDGLVPSEASDAAHELMLEGIQFVIGPLGDDAVIAAAPILDASNALFVHYGFESYLISESSLGFLGMPLPELSVPVLADHLLKELDSPSLSVLAYGSEEAISQKRIVERICKMRGFELMPISRFDISEEIFDIQMEEHMLVERVERVLEVDPDVLILTGCPPDVFVVIVDRFRRLGYRGAIAAQNAQDASKLLQLGMFSDNVYFVGGSMSGRVPSPYYRDLKARYLSLGTEWNDEVDTKLYAMDFIVQMIQRGGLETIGHAGLLRNQVDEFDFIDRFTDPNQVLPYLGKDIYGANRILGLPILISKIEGGESFVVANSVTPQTN